MVKYKDGADPEIGDVVRGPSYRLKGHDREPLSLVGVVVSVTPGAGPCNLMIAVTHCRHMPKNFLLDRSLLQEARGVTFVSGQRGRWLALTTLTEYGQAEQFELIQREVFP